jgi:hypothetical protein
MSSLSNSLTISSSECPLASARDSKKLPYFPLEMDGRT